VNNKVRVSHDIAFDENMFWQWDADGQEEQVGHPFTVENLVKEPELAAADAHFDGDQGNRLCAIATRIC
jgi:hypothetical protein